MTRRTIGSCAAVWLAVIAIALAIAAPLVAQAPVAQSPAPGPLPAGDAELTSAWHQLTMAGLRLPLAALLGAALALRPRRPGTPARSMPVIETQIILASVGALVMLVVGASLARAFGIVGAANLIRYRAKIDDPKDAVVMLAALAVGLACGVGLYVLATAGTVLIGVALWTIESFEPKATTPFELKVTAKGASGLEPRIERVLRAHRAKFELRASGEEVATYLVNVPADLSIDHVTKAVTALAPDSEITVEWDEKKPKKA